MPEKRSVPTPLTVTASHRLSPELVRVDFHSDDLAAFTDSGFTDRYVKLVFPVPGVDYPEPFDMRAVRESYPPEHQPVIRTYTALDPDVDAGTVSIEFVVHGTEGVAGPWAVAAQPGDTLLANGPGGAYAPDPEADWHLFAGDESGLPAIRAALAALPDDAVAAAYVEVEGPGHEVDVPVPAKATLTWVHRGSDTRATMEAASGAEPPFLGAVRAQEWLPGRVQCFVHGEGEVVMKGIRPYLFIERQVPREDVSISGYWRRGRTEEGFRDWKSELRATEGA